jgi:hypothetical protein
MASTHLLGLSLLGALALVACGKFVLDPSPDVSSGSGAAGSSASGSGAGGAGGGPTSDLDAGTDAPSPCTQLDIGIFGNPGANPSSDFQQWLAATGTSVQRIQTTPGVPITAATLQPFDVIVLDRLTRDYTASEAAAFAAWVSVGGGVASMSGYDGNTTDDWHANSLLAPLEVAYSGPLISGPVTQFAAHPITAGITSMTFSGGYAISDLGGTASTRTPIAFLPASSGSGTVPVSYAIQMGAGRAFVWGDEWIEFDSDWSDSEQLWVQVFAWIAPASTCALAPMQ